MPSEKAARQWWPVALSHEVTSKQPLSVDIGDQPVVLWRDASGMPRALEDRCPHRRAPLSLGCVRDEGWLQCGYHGWSFDGPTGRVMEIPNLKGEQRFPPLYRAQPFGVQEAGGFIRVCLDPDAARPPTAVVTPARSGMVNVSLDHERYLAVLFDDPTLAFTIPGVVFTDYLMSDLHESDGRLVMERSCKWRTNPWPAAFAGEFALTLWTATDPVTGETEIRLRDSDYRVLVQAVLAPTPAARGVTAIRWRAGHGRSITSLQARLLRLRAPISVRSWIDGTALRRLRVSASAPFQTLRAAMAEPAQPADHKETLDA